MSKNSFKNVTIETKKDEIFGDYYEIYSDRTAGTPLGGGSSCEEVFKYAAEIQARIDKENMALADLVKNTLLGNRVEPKKRMVGGKFGWAIHTHPIKGGVSMAKVIVDNIKPNNSLIFKLKKMKTKNNVQ